MTSVRTPRRRLFPPRRNHRRPHGFRPQMDHRTPQPAEWLAFVRLMS
ncbi:hypothetical protein [Streptomyces sp. cg35]